MVSGARALMALHFLVAAEPPRPEDDEIRRKTREVLSRPEFDRRHTPDFVLRILEALGNALEWLGALRYAAPLVFWCLVCGLTLLLALLLAHISRTVYRALAGGPRRPQDELGAEGRQRLSQTYRDEAQRKAADGEFTEAIRFLFLSLVYRFDENGRVSFQKAYTNREYLDLFADRPDLRSDLQVFVDTLDENWYGQHPTERGRYENCLGLYRSLQ